MFKCKGMLQALLWDALCSAAIGYATEGALLISTNLSAQIATVSVKSSASSVNSAKCLCAKTKGSGDCDEYEAILFLWI